MKNRKFLITFCFLVLFDLVCFIFIPQLTYFTKPLIVGSLLAHYIVSVPKQNHIYILALIFEMLAQVFLAFSKNDTSYLFSLISSSIVILCLILLYKRVFTFPDSRGLKAASVLLIITAILHLLSYKVQIYKNVTAVDYILIGLVYLFVLLAINLKSSGVKVVLVLGAIILGISKLFNNPDASPLDLVPIILTYAIGHYLINFGLVSSYQKASAKKVEAKK